MSTWSARLARWRIRLGFLVGAAAIWLAAPTWASLARGALVALCGEGLRLWAAGHLEKGREVTRSGPYRWVRHPLYVGSLLIGVGFALAARHPASAVLVLAYLALTLSSAVRTEEAGLRERFGVEYDEYAAGRLDASDRRFNLRRALGNREHRALAGLVAVTLILAWKAARAG